MKAKVTPSTGNVFRDLGFRRAEAEHFLVWADFLIQVQKLIASRRLKQKTAAKILGVSQPRVSDLLQLTPFRASNSTGTYASMAFF
jgi:predicted XRE-type DNA-binding protein